MKLCADKAEVRWWWYIVLRIGIIIGSVVLLLSDRYDGAIVLVIFGATVASSLFQWRSDHWKSLHQLSLDKFELSDGLGWTTTSRERSNWLAKLSSKDTETVIASVRVEDEYFASLSASSNRRLLENLEESTWFSKHLAMYTAVAFGAFIFVIVFVSVGTFVAVAQSSPNASMVRDSAKIFVAIVAAMFSVGLIRLTVDYLSFSGFCSKTEESVSDLLDKGSSITTQDAIKLLHEYQTVRARSPLLPNQIWKWKHSKLSAIWSTQRVRMRAFN